jgi:hypothetical protein
MKQAEKTIKKFDDRGSIYYRFFLCGHSLKLDVRAGRVEQKCIAP